MKNVYTKQLPPRMSQCKNYFRIDKFLPLSSIVVTKYKNMYTLNYSARKFRYVPKLTYTRDIYFLHTVNNLNDIKLSKFRFDDTIDF